MNILALLLALHALPLVALLASRKIVGVPPALEPAFSQQSNHEAAVVAPSASNLCIITVTTSQRGLCLNRRTMPNYGGWAGHPSCCTPLQPRRRTVRALL
ncbi:hypothetical protein ACCO45_008539 [Purpureocillium lilacinum]|uniref:Uncharacterized protein n=1 Tax=Purpureocillium lilacinum TaxID=33203 RepID=A0ACC4DNK8_PURLI